MGASCMKPSASKDNTDPDLILELQLNEQESIEIKINHNPDLERKVKIVYISSRKDPR